MYNLENIIWEKNEAGDISIVARPKGSESKQIVSSFKKISKKITMRTLVKKAIGDRGLVVACCLSTDQPGKFQLGPSGNLYNTLVHQGIILEHEPTIKI